MKRLAVLAVLLALAIPGLAEQAPMERVLLDVIHPVPVQELQFLYACTQVSQRAVPAATFDTYPENQTFHFREVGQASASGEPPGYATAGCGQAAYETEIPAATDHIHVRFFGSRGVQLQPGGVHSVTGPRFIQEVSLNTTTGGELVYNYFEVDDGAEAMQFQDPSPPYFPGANRAVKVQWRFQDLGTSLDNALTSVPGGASYSGWVATPYLEFSGIPMDGFTVAYDTNFLASSQVARAIVTVPVTPQAIDGRNLTDVRVQADVSRGFESVRTPAGVLLDTAVTRTSAGPLGFDRSRILVERASGILQVTIPHEVLTAHGPGEYQVILKSESVAQPVAALVPMALLFLLLPFPFAILAMVNVRRFEKVAFGGYKRSARFLRYAVLAAGAYYFAVVLASLLGGRLGVLARFPFPAEALGLYVQLALAGLAFVGLWLAATELYRLTVPGEQA